MLNLKKEVQNIEIPRHLSFDSDEAIKLTFTNKITKKEYEFEVYDVSTHPKLYLFEGIDLSKLDDGEYVYTVLNGVITDLGLALIGNYNKNNIVYNGDKETIQYEG